MVGCVATSASVQSPAVTEVVVEEEILWGYSQETPLPMKSIPASLDYLDRLYTLDGVKVEYQRLESVKIYTGEASEEGLLGWLGLGQRPGPILDKYEIITPKGSVFLWINPYARRAPLAPPKGFMVVP